MDKKAPLLTKTIVVLLVSMIAANIGGQMYGPLLPLYVQSLGADMNQIGIFFTLSMVAPLLSPPEEVVLKDGVVLNPNFDTYLMPTAADSPAMTVMAIEGFDESGPYGAKGGGEGSLNPIGGAVASAVARATGVWSDHVELPLTPERVWRLLQEAGDGH